MYFSNTTVTIKSIQYKYTLCTSASTVQQLIELNHRPVDKIFLFKKAASRWRGSAASYTELGAHATAS